ncbi:MAG TPA: putative inorganic carbon transporter subunit DabA, partial [Oceanipulchritudo sp.]|nr:putative inorganic carbon transporter subunit DabA [Oceanipulchritudo sp.]
FVHHNPLHALQDLDFFDASLLVSRAFGIETTLNPADYRQFHRQGRITDEIIDKVIRRKNIAGPPLEKRNQLLHLENPTPSPQRVGRLRARWNEFLPFPLEDRIEPILFRWLGGFLDQGNADWLMPPCDGGLLDSLRQLEQQSHVSLFRTDEARHLIHQHDLTLRDLLKRVVGHESYFDNYLIDQQFAHRGWSGLVSVIEQRPETLFEPREARLRDLIHFELILEIDVLEQALGKGWEPLGHRINDEPVDYFELVEPDPQQQALRLWQEAFEWTYYDQVLAGITFLRQQGGGKEPQARKQEPSFQGVFCVDDRECSLRRYLEAADPACQTYGAPGFFGVVAYFKPYGACHIEKNCPAPLTPKHLIKELKPRPRRSKVRVHDSRPRSLLHGLLPAFALGASSGLRLLSDLMNPSVRPDVMQSFSHMNANGELSIECTDPGAPEEGLKVGFEVAEMVDIVADFLSSIGLKENFAPLFYVVAHGGTTANNPHHAAYDCGACSGRPGALNARVFAAMANRTDVRLKLADRGIHIPEETRFVAAMHDTSQDHLRYYDVSQLPESLQERHAENIPNFEKALDSNARERARRFASIERDLEPERLRRAIERRAVSYFEPRPELGHGSNALCYVGRRHSIKGLFLDRRAFLQSYECIQDPDGETLLEILTPLVPVCGGINLEYYFSRMDNHKMGCGTKLSHNVTGLIGVTNSTD